jgi:hypothetical protein
MTMTHYTPLEIQVIGTFSTAFNYSDPESEKEDNATVLEVKDVQLVTGLPLPVIKGVFSSLYEKGLLEQWDEPGAPYDGSSWVTPKGIDAHYTLKNI